jgi:hypothetical protein
MEIEYIYYPPKNQEARRIWNECYLGSSATDAEIIKVLRGWVYFNANIYDKIISDGIYEMYIRWEDANGVSYDMAWSTFLKWFHCACTPDA